MTQTTVLLVDDDEDFLAANGAALEGAGFQVLKAHNKTEAFALALENPVDVAVLDVMMDTPDEGFVLAREMRANEQTKNIPLVMLTSVNEVNRQAGYTFTFSDRDRDDTWLPIDKFLDKPVKPQTLTETVSLFMKKR